MQTPENWGNVPFKDAIELMAARGVVLPDEYYGKLQGIARQKAFSIAGITSLDQLTAVSDSLKANMAAGKSFNQWKKEQAVQDLGLPKHRLDNIYRTNLQGQYMAGKWLNFEKFKNSRPYLMYDAINDSRVRPSHLALDGIIRPVGDAFFATHSPPCGFRCRCSLISLTKDQAQKRSGDNKGLNQYPVNKDGTPANPDKGWDYDKRTDRMAGVDKAYTEKSVKLDTTLKQASDEKMLKAWDGTNIAKRISVVDISSVKNLLDEYARLFPDHLPHGVKSVEIASPDDKFFMGTDSRGLFKIADIDLSTGFNPAKDLVAGLDNINKGKLLTPHHEYAIEGLWHEIWHNRQLGGEKLWMLDEFSETRIAMETVNQYVSRLSYGGFIDRLGGAAIHQEWVLKNGYGYGVQVKRMNAIFDKFGIKESIAGDLFNINANKDLMLIIPLIAEAISKKTKISIVELESLIRSMSVDEDFEFLAKLNELDYPN